jgi:hypothetical protein
MQCNLVLSSVYYTRGNTESDCMAYLLTMTGIVRELSKHGKRETKDEPRSYMCVLFVVLLISLLCVYTCYIRLFSITLIESHAVTGFCHGLLLCLSLCSNIILYTRPILLSFFFSTCVCVRCCVIIASRRAHPFLLFSSSSSWWCMTRLC